MSYFVMPTCPVARASIILRFPNTCNCPSYRRGYKPKTVALWYVNVEAGYFG